MSCITNVRRWWRAGEALGVLLRALDVPGLRAGTGGGRDAVVGRVQGRLWAPRRVRGGPILLAAGVTPAGPGDPRVERLADALAAAGRRVFVPRLLLSDHELDEEDVERLVLATRALSRARRDVTVLGFSFGGSYALVAAADERLAARVRRVAAFGAYADLTGVLRAATTGMSLRRGRRVPWPAGASTWGAGSDAVIDTDFARVLLTNVADLVPGVGVADLDRAVRGSGTEDLPAPAAAACRLLGNRRPERVEALAAALPPPLARLLERLSPASVASRVRCPVVLAHAVDDPTVPFAEMQRLRDAFPEAAAYPVHLFTHVDFAPTPRHVVRAARDLWRLWRFTTVVLT